MSDAPIVSEVGVNPPDSCVIWLHGLGADGHDFEPIVPELRIDPGMNVRFIFPNAPMIPVTINQGHVMRAWYDIKAVNISAEPDSAGIQKSAKLIDQIIEQQIEVGIASERIVLAGFSQGGAIALQTGLRFGKKLAGIMALSTYLPLADSVESEREACNQDISIFMAHGSVDPVIPIDLAYLSRGQLERLRYSLEWQEYAGMPHSVSEKEINDIASWLESVIGTLPRRPG
jgi:phospholipase/carboxylesterase